MEEWFCRGFLHLVEGQVLCQSGLPALHYRIIVVYILRVGDRSVIRCFYFFYLILYNFFCISDAQMWLILILFISIKKKNPLKAEFHFL